jgi:hypothetical protein
MKQTFYFVSCSRHVAVLHEAKNSFSKFRIFRNSITIHHYQDHTVNGASVDPISRVHSYRL